MRGPQTVRVVILACRAITGAQQGTHPPMNTLVAPVASALAEAREERAPEPPPARMEARFRARAKVEVEVTCNKGKGPLESAARAGRQWEPTHYCEG